MMKINLLGQDAPKLKAAAGSSAAARQVLVFVVALAVSVSTVGLVYYYWGHQITRAQAALTHEQIRQKDLASVRAQNQEYQRQLKFGLVRAYFENGVLPGFGVTMGFTLLYLSLIVLIPVAGVFLKTAQITWSEFWSISLPISK